MKGLKKLSLVLAALTVSASGAVFAACSALENVDHPHQYDWTVTTPATCTEDGVETGTCSICNGTTTRPIEAPGHDYEWETTTPATCTEDGEKTGTCSVCGDVTTETITSPGHDYEWETTTPATCTEDGEKTGTCSECGDVTTETITSPGHNYEWETTTPATCTVDGEKTGTCSECGDVTTETITAPGHNYEWETTTPATCTAAGEKAGTCSVCGDTTTETIPALEHSFSAWTVTTPATCTQDGEETESCPNCNELGTATRPVTALGHDYGNWQITIEATSNTEGAVKKVCSHDSAHNHDIVKVLPQLSSTSAYKSVEVVNSNTGLKRFTVDFGADGEFSFNAYTLDVQDAVTVAYENDHKVIKNTTYVYMDMPMYSSGAGGGKNNALISYEYGANRDCVHIIDESMYVDGWYTFMSDGFVFGVMEKENRIYQKVLQKDPSEDKPYYKDGYLYNFTFFNGEEKNFGVGNFVDFYYKQAKNSPNGDFYESVSVANGKTVYSFGYSQYYTEYGDHLNIVNVKFSLNEDGVIEDAVVECKTYVNAAAYTTEDGVTHAAVTGFTKNEDGSYTLTNASKYGCWQKFTINQTSKLAAGASYVENPYKFEDLTVSSFDLQRVTVDGSRAVTGRYEMIEDEYTLKPTAGLNMQPVNVSPSTANLYVDTLSFYLRTVDEDGKTVDNLLKFGYDIDDGNIAASHDPVENVIALNSYIAGEHTFVIKSDSGYEKVLTLNVPFIAPSSFTANVAVYDASTDAYSWDNFNTEYEVYQGQELKFTSLVPHPFYEDATFTATVTGPSNVTPTNGFVEGTEVKVFKANATGTYTISLDATQGGGSATITVVVEEAPSEEDLFNENYKSKDKQTKVEFDTEKHEVYVTLGSGDNSTETVLSYSYDAATRTISTTYVRGASWNNMNMGLELDDAYNMFLYYTSEFGTPVYTYIFGTLPNAITGTHKLTKNIDAAEVLKCNIEGTYSIELGWFKNVQGQGGDTAGVFYAMNGGDPVLIESATFELELKEDDTFKIWAIAVGDVDSSYKVTLVGGEVTPVSKVILNTSERNIYEGDSYTLKATVFPKSATDASVTWLSSDPTVATVDENGVVKALKVGETTITVTTVDGGKTATCTITVIEMERYGVGDNALASLDETGISFVLEGTVNNIYELKVVKDGSELSNVEFVYGTERGSKVEGTLTKGSNVVTLHTTDGSTLTNVTVVVTCTGDTNGQATGTGTEEDPFVITKYGAFTNEYEVNDWGWTTPDSYFYKVVVAEGEYVFINADNANITINVEAGEWNEYVTELSVAGKTLGAGTYYLQVNLKNGNSSTITVKSCPAPQLAEGADIPLGEEFAIEEQYNTDTQEGQYVFIGEAGETYNIYITGNGFSAFDAYVNGEKHGESSVGGYNNPPIYSASVTADADGKISVGYTMTGYSYGFVVVVTKA